MLEETIKNNLFYHYLLGTLSEAQQAQLEEEYFSQPERGQELWAIFDEMAERFFQGEMDAQDAQKFAVQLQTKPFLRARAESLQALYQVLFAPVPKPDFAARQIPERHTNPSIIWFFRHALSWGLLATGVLFLAIGGWLLSRQATDQEREIAQARPTVALDPAPPSVTATPTAEPSAAPRIKPKPNRSPAIERRANLVAFYILQEDARAQGEAVKLAITEQTQTIELHVEVQPPFLSRYQGVAKTSKGQTFKSFTNLQVQPQKNMAFVTLQLAVAEIPTSHFTVQIKTASAGNDAPLFVSQVFAIEKE